MRGSLQNRARAYVAFLRTFGDLFWLRIHFAAFVAFFVIEGGLRLLAIQWSSRATTFAKSTGIGCTFNPEEYPRICAVAASREPNFIRLSLWMLLLGGASTYVLAHGDSPDPLELQIVTAGCVMLAVTGAFMIFSRFTARVVLEPDAVAVRALVGGAMMSRQDIRGVREYQRGKGPHLIELVPWRPETAPLRLPPVTYEDGHFCAWFDSLPQLAVSAQSHAGAPAPRRT